MAGLIHYRNADGLNNDPVSAATPLPVRGADALAITDGSTSPVVATTGSPTVAAGDISFTAASQDVIIDATGYGGISLTVNGTWVGGIQVLWSNKSTGPWKNGIVDSSNAGLSGSVPLLTISGNDQYVGAHMGRYVRVLMSAYTSGTAVVTPVLLRDVVARDVYVNNANTAPIPTSPQATSVSGGLTAPNRLVSSAATTNATSVKNAAGRVYSIIGRNTNAADRFLKLYNKASAPTVGTDTPFATFTLPASSAFAIEPPVAMYLATGIAFALTTAAADADTGAVGAADITGLNVFYI